MLGPVLVPVGKLDPVPLEAMVEAEKAVREAADQIAPELTERLVQAHTLASPDREAILALARRALAPFPGRIP